MMPNPKRREIYAVAFAPWRDDYALPDPVLDWSFAVAKGAAELALMTDMATDVPAGLVEIAGKDG